VEYTDYGRGAELRLIGYSYHLASAMKRLENYYSLVIFITMEFMLRSKKQEKKEGLFNFRIAKVVSFFSKEIHLKIELKITKKHSGEN
jgi:hypothetical protein